uniref:Structural maintenance of chromosomes protein 5 n=1 Tax=Oncorhynchus tshawytscha TaxID=74940 RepID=A0A8C8F0V2_ONCTS
SNNEVSSSSGTETDPRPVGDVKLTQFTPSHRTYDHSIVHPGPNPNMIVGANGTGKSSIVGLYGLYVKRECNKGSVEIKLQAGGNLVINREMHVENNQSVWLLNGRHSSQKAVEEVKALQIQVSNLCQFLPQEKVGEFAKMTKIELLEATEKSVGPPEMYEFHCKLKIFRTKERELEVSTKASALEKFKQRKEQNKHGVERYYEKRRHLDMIKMLHKKKPWVEYETACNELEGVKKEREDANKQLKTVRESQAPMLKKIQHIDSQLRPIENQMKDKVRQRISNTRWMIDDLRAEVANLGDRSDVTPRLGVGNAELKHIHEEKADLRRENDNLNRECKLLKNRLRSLDDMMKIKEEKLRGRSKDTYAALKWLEAEQTLHVRSPKNAKYVENHIPFNDLRAFTFQKREDMEKFMTEVRDGQNLRVNSVFAPEESCATPPLPDPLNAFFIFPVCRRFGFFAYLFDAPEEVMSYLCNQYKVHNVPVGTDQTKAMIKTVIEEPYLKVLYTAEEKYSLKKSFYSGKTSTSNSAVWPSQYFTMAEDKRHLEEQISAAEKSMNVLPNRIELRAQKKALSELKGKKRQLEQKISTKQDSLWQMAQGAEEETKAQISAVNSQKVSIVAEFMAHMKLRARLSMEKVYMALETVGMTAEKTKLETDCKEGSAELRVLEVTHQRTACLLEKCKGMLRRAREICNMDPGKSVVPPDLHTAFSQMPNTLDEMDAMLNEERSRAECFTGLRENMVDEYNRREQEIKNLEKELDDKSNALAPTDRTYQSSCCLAQGQNSVFFHLL